MTRGLGNARLYLSALFDTVREPLLILNRDLTVENANRSFYRLFHLSPADTERKFFCDLEEGVWNIPTLRRMLDDILLHDASFDDYEVRHTFPAIGSKVLLFNGRKILDVENSREAILLAIEDVTTQDSIIRVLEQEVVVLKLANEELEAFSSVAAHDLKTPLAEIRMLADVIANDETLSRETRRDLLTRLINAARRMHRLIVDLLKYAKVSRKSEDKSDIDLGHLMEQIIADMEGFIAGTMAEVNIEWPLPRIRGSVFQMRQLFQNLLSNAVKYGGCGDEPPRVRIAGAVTGNIVEVVIRDNGRGIAKDCLEKIFEPFERLSEIEGGTGLGLAICRRIVEHHDGRIYIKDTSGKGTTFAVCLPAAD